jgi:urease accessory protein
MWVDRVLGNVADQPACSPGSIDFVDVDWAECGRMLKARTRSGHPIRLLLPPGSTIRHGDVLVDDGACRVVVNVPPCDVIVARPATAREMALLCLELGNLHWPTQVTDSQVIFIEDGPPLAVLEQLNVAWVRESRRFEPTPIGTGPGVQLSPGFKVVRRG